MKKSFLLGVLALLVCVPFFVEAGTPPPAAWKLGSPVSQSDWIKNAAGATNSEKCTTVLNRTSCDFTDNPKALRIGYEYEFADEFWAGEQDRQMRAQCTRFDEKWDYNQVYGGDGSIQAGVNPTFSRTPELTGKDYWVAKNTNMIIVRANRIYQINARPDKRSSDNLFIKYVIEYSNDQNGNTRYQHTECYPYEISRCGDGQVDKDWFKKDPSDPAEQCDPGDTRAPSVKGWGTGTNYTCSPDCTLIKEEVKAPKCNSNDYNTKTKYTDLSSEDWLKGTEKLCDEGEVDSFRSSRNVGQVRNFTWYCKNSEGKRTDSQCRAKQEWCGDGVYNEDHEQCDPEDKRDPSVKGRGAGTYKTCNASCEIIDNDAACSSQYNGKNVYTSNSTHYLNGTASENLCNVGSLKQGTFGFNFIPGFPVYYQGNPYGPLQYKWLCENGKKTSSECTLKQYRCGDGDVNDGRNPRSFIDGAAHYEACDPKDPDSKGECGENCDYLPAICGPANSTTAVYNSNYPTSRIKESELCKTGKLKEGSFSGPDSNGNYKWECINVTKEEPCGAKDSRCGDNKYQKDYEQCDPTDPNRTNWEEGTWKTCNSNCTLTGIVRNKPVCNSYFSGVNKYTEFDSTPWVKESDYLCTQGTKGGYTYSREGNKRVFKWTCSKDGYTVNCSASQTWCGDGVKNNNEDCDSKDDSHQGWGDGGCSQKCEPIYGPAKCGSEYNDTNNMKKEYLDINLSWLYENTPGLCDAGTVTGFRKHIDSPIYTWQCENHGKVSNECQADQEWCGDGIIQNDYEQCDPENPGWKNRTDGMGCSASCEKEWCGDGIVQKYLGEECDGGKGCTSQCKLVNIPQTGCNEYFTRSLRLGETKIFIDTGDAGWHDRYFYHQDVKFSENHGDYNNGANPIFNWTDQLVKAGMKLDANTSMQIIQSTPYHLITPPSVRAPNNLYVEYTVWYDNVRYEYIPPKENLYSHKECFKYEISRCGDGQIDTGYNEVCDPGSPETSIAPSGEICNDKCQFEKVPAPVCNSKYQGQPVDNLTENDDLCSEGTYTTGSLHFNETTNTWTWKCDNVAGIGTGCSATKKVIPTGEPEIEKTLKDKVMVRNVNQKLTWTIEITAKGGDIKDFKVRDKLPNVLEYKTFRVVKNEDNLKVSDKPNGPVKSGSYNIYTWDVTGTLHSGHKLIIEVDSVVLKMPTKKDNYRNIACVEDDVIRCDDDQPGTAEILKELQNKKEVTETGQKLDWKVTVIASGGDIENFEIWDKLPVELDFTGWQLDKANTQNGVTVKYDGKRSPTLSGDVNIHYWNVSGILYSGNKITMIVKSTVNRMPKSGEDILNIACVVQSGSEIDCAEDNPPSSKGKPEIEKTLKNKVIVNAVNQKLTWTVKVTAKGGDIKDFKVRDKLPNVLKYDTFRIVKNEDNLKVSSKPSGPVESGSYNIYTWDVTGTLHEGHELIIEIDSIVVKMPTKKDDYRNIACVEDDKVVDCDDAQPGEAKILKELQNKKEVTETGQELDWKVTVIASGGDIENFEIWDKLPIELDYAGWELDKKNTQNGITVTHDDKRSPKLSGDVNIHYWNVDGILYSGNKITMIVKSTVKRMPTSGEDILNVACVVQSGNEIDCAEDNPPKPGTKGEPEIEKTLKNKVIVNAVNQKLTWTVKVTAKGGDIKDFKVRDKLPKVLKYETYRVVKNEDNLKLPNQPSGPVESGSNNIYTWNVTGTLHEGHELILEIDSVVVKMPTKKDDYLNVACVEDDNKIDCDDAKPGTAEILKELQKKREVTETGQELDWKVTVIASGGDIENFEIWDKLPVELDYAGWELDKANTQDKVTVTYDDNRSPKPSGDVNIHYWNVKGVLYSGNKITMIVKSTVKRMPTSGEDILNVACVVQSGNEIDCAEDNPPKPGGKLVIQKTLNPKKLVTETGEILTWDIKVTASGGAVTGGFKISDIVPYALEFTGVYKIKDNPAKLTMGKWHKGDISDLKTWEGGEFTGEVWTLDVNGGLEQNQSLVLTVTTRVVKMPKTEDDYRNVACVIKDDTQECDDDKPKQKPDLRIKKHFTDGTKSGKVVKIGDEIAYRITFGNSGNSVASITSIKDFLPKNVKYKSSEIFVNGKKIHTESTQSGDKSIFKGFKAVDGIHIDIYGGIDLNPGYTGYIILTGEVLRDFTGYTTNFACIYLNDDVVDCDDATHKVEDEVTCKTPEFSPSTFDKVCTSDKSEFSTTVTCKSDGGKADIEIICDGKSIKTGYAQQLTGICSSTTNNKDNKVQCKVNGSLTGADGKVCEGSFRRDTKTCGGGCINCGGGGGPTPPTDYCDENSSDPICLLADPRCFNVNAGNFSIESGEILPFYFNVYKKESSYTYKYLPNESDDATCDSGTIDLSSLRCKYKILSPDNNRIVYSGEFDCLQDNAWVENDTLIGQWAKAQDDQYGINLRDDNGSTYWPTIETSNSSGWKINDTLGEYKFQIEVVDFRQCTAENKWTRARDDEGYTPGAVCQSNFVLTAPYTVQKTPSGNLRASTVTLAKFKEADGDDVGFSKYLDAISTTVYTPNSKVDEAMEVFIEKYKKLAVEVDTQKFGKDGVTVKKVPGKDIYFIDGNATFVQNNTTINKPFTIVQTNGSTTINGNLNHNMMLLTKGNITFSGNCTTGQTVRGIFYAQGNLVRQGVKKNNNPNNNVWCTNGGLIIKGVLIGNNFDNLMMKSRSHLETWFQSKGNNQELTNKVMNGASVVIEYSPSIFTKSTMPPGAEDFTTALSIYKN